MVLARILKLIISLIIIIIIIIIFLYIFKWKFNAKFVNFLLINSISYHMFYNVVTLFVEYV